jgi:Rho-related BTB domain-containing protein 1/2
LYTDDVPAISPARCLDLLELGNRLCLPRLVNLVERRVVEEMVRLCGSDGADVVVEHCLRLLEPCKVAVRWNFLFYYRIQNGNTVS